MPLYLVSTPIGNLEDMTLRAIRILKEADLILAEDTRVTGRLLKHFEISTRMLSYHAHNERKRTPQVVRELAAGRSIALVSDAGTPLLSDPGQFLVQSVIAADLPVIPIPGASAFLAALAASGLPTNRVVFEGFIPKKKGRSTRLQKLSLEAGTIVLYESAYRVQKTIQDIGKVMGNRYIVVSREITKRYEEFIRGNALDLIADLDNRVLKGEFVLLIAGTEFKRFNNPDEITDE